MGHKRRREFLFAAGALLATRLANAQQPQGMRRIGWLIPGAPPPGVTPFGKVLLESLARLGFEEGKNLSIERRYADNVVQNLPALANELVRLRVELIVTSGPESTAAAREATRTIPIVMLSWLPVDHGFIQSHARPGTNITGIDMWPSDEKADKEYEFLKRVVPGAKRAVRLWNPTQKAAHLWGDEHVRNIREKLGLTLLSAEMTQSEDLRSALDRIAKLRPRPDVFYVSSAEPFPRHFSEIAAFAVKQKLPSIASSLQYTSAGGLLGHGPLFRAIAERLASYIDRVLRGADPATLPVEQPSKYELVLNMKTAKAIGLTVPPAFLQLVDRTID